MTKKKPTQTEKYINQAVERAKEELSSDHVTISHCEFIGIKFEPEAVDVLAGIARACQTNAEALVNNANTLLEVAKKFSPGSPMFQIGGVEKRGGEE